MGLVTMKSSDERRVKNLNLKYPFIYYTVEFASMLEARIPVFDKVLRPPKIDRFNDEATYKVSVSFEAAAGNVVIRETYILARDPEPRLGAHSSTGHMTGTKYLRTTALLAWA